MVDSLQLKLIMDCKIDKGREFSRFSGWVCSLLPSTSMVLEYLTGRVSILKGDQANFYFFKNCKFPIVAL